MSELGHNTHVTFLTQCRSRLLDNSTLRKTPLARIGDGSLVDDDKTFVIGHSVTQGHSEFTMRCVQDCSIPFADQEKT